MGPVESTWRWKRWVATGTESAISKVFSILDADLPSGWRRLTGDDLIAFGSLVRPGSGWYGLEPDPSHDRLALSIERPVPDQLRGGWVRSPERHGFADSNGVLATRNEVGRFLDEGLIPRESAWDEVSRFLDEGVIPAAKAAGVLIRVPPPEAASFANQPFEVEDRLRRFLDADCKSLPFDSKEGELWRDFVVAVFRTKAIIEAESFINWLVATGWPMESAAALYSQLGDDCLLLARVRGRGVCGMTSIPAVAAQFLAQPAPVLIIDTCNFLDLFRRDGARPQPRVPADEIRIASILLEKVTDQPGSIHLVVPELVPGEFADHADRIEREFEKWLEAHDENQFWLADAAQWVGTALPSPSEVYPFALQAAFRRLANDLLARAIVLDRDQTSLDRAVARLIARRRPSHEKEIKDSMNLEQSLELCSGLRNTGFTRRVAFISSNTKDYAASPSSFHVHADLQPDFAAVSMEYIPSLRAAAGALSLP